jgi:hypothetical protein
MLLPAIQLGLPLLLVIWLWVLPMRSRFGLATQFLAVMGVMAAIWLAGIWTTVPRWTLAVLAVSAIVATARGWRAAPAKLSFGGWLQLIAGLALLVFAGGALGEIWRGHQPPPIPSIKLASPLNGDDLVVANGGSSLLLNAHQDTLDLSILRHRLWHGQSYGVDIVAMTQFGTTSDGVRPADPKRYAIFGRQIYAPCTGSVVTLSNDRPDLAVPAVDSKIMEGNHIRLRCNGVEVVMAHLKQGSVKVVIGQWAKVGQVIGAVGNSGMSDEPHLHIHAQTPGTAAAPFSGRPVAMLLGHRFLARNDRI